MKTHERIRKILDEFRGYELSEYEAEERIMDIVNETQLCSKCLYSDKGLMDDPCDSCNHKCGIIKLSNYEPKP